MAPHSLRGALNGRVPVACKHRKSRVPRESRIRQRETAQHERAAFRRLHRLCMSAGRAQSRGDLGGSVHAPTIVPVSDSRRRWCSSPYPTPDGFVRRRPPQPRSGSPSRFWRRRDTAPREQRIQLPQADAEREVTCSCHPIEQSRDRSDEASKPMTDSELAAITVRVTGSVLSHMRTGPSATRTRSRSFDWAYSPLAHLGTRVSLLEHVRCRRPRGLTTANCQLTTGN